MNQLAKTSQTLGDRLFSDMSRPLHAYCLGLVCGAGRMKGDVLELRLRGNGQPLRALLKWAGGQEANSLLLGKDRLRLFAPLGQRAMAFLGGRLGERVDLPFPDFSGEMLVSYLRGWFDARGRISPAGSEQLIVEVEQRPGPFRDQVVAHLGAPHARGDERRAVLSGVAAFDALGLLYDGVSLSALDWSPKRPGPPPLCRQKHFRRYLAWAAKQTGNSSALPALRFARTDALSVLPHKQRVSDSGYDLTLISEKMRTGRVVLYGTGIVAQPPPGWYLDVVPRSSIIRSGYILANSVGIIDQAYRGEIMVPLIKLDDAAPELELPARVVQLIPRPVVHFPVELVGELTSTERGAKGFGSSG